MAVGGSYSDPEMSEGDEVARIIDVLSRMKGPLGLDL